MKTSKSPSAPFELAPLPWKDDATSTTRGRRGVEAAAGLLSTADGNLRKQLAAMFSLPEENVRAIYVEGAGCYDRNGHATGSNPGLCLGPPAYLM